jgi:hypothetical protein
MYHLDGHQKCWFETEVTAAAQKHVHHHLVKRSDVKYAERRKMAVLNARDQLLTSASAQVSPRPPSDASDIAPTVGSETAELASAGPVRLQRTSDQPATTNDNPRLSGTLLTVASLDENGTMTSASQVTAERPSVPGGDKDQGHPMATRFGMASIALGLLMLLTSLLASRFLNSNGAVRTA